MQDVSASAMLRELIDIPSASSMSNRPMIDFAREVLQPQGWHFREVVYADAHGVEKVNLIATPPCQAEDDFSVDLAFVCHTDTVPYSVEWSHAAQSRTNDGMLHGWGACDVKGFLACLLVAFAGAPPEQFAQKVALVLTAEEEIGCVGAKHLLAANLLQARHVVVGEPTSLHPARAGKGYGLAEVVVFGKEAHSAHPTQGVSAIYHAARLIERIEQLARSLESAPHRAAGGLFDPPCTTLNVGTITGGTAKNVVPGECRFLLEWRPLPGEAIGALSDAVRKIADELRRDDDSFSCEMTVLREQAGFESREDSPLLRQWMEISGRPPIGVPFGTEAPLINTLTHNVIVVGPGDMRTAHSARECVPLAELDLCVSYLRELIARPLEA